MTMKQILKGALTYVPGVRQALNRTGNGNTISSEYCYALWLKHIVMLHEAGHPGPAGTMAELGPGGSLGVGLSGILCGMTKYSALDVIEYANVDDNLRVFEELVERFNQRQARPVKGWPDFDPYLPEDLFPHDVLTDDLLAETLAPERLSAIREAIKNPGQTFDGIQINYYAPWNNPKVVENNSVDLLMSQSTLEHVEDLNLTYDSIAKWLKPGAWMSHQIDFGSHGISSYWDGYRKYSEPQWKIVKGARHYLINRQPHSVHVQHMKRVGFDIVTEMANENGGDPKMPNEKLASKWKDLSPIDMNARESYVAAKLR